MGFNLGLKGLNAFQNSME